MPTDTGGTMPVEMGDVVVNFSKRILAFNVTIFILCQGVPFAVLPSTSACGLYIKALLYLHLLGPFWSGLRLKINTRATGDTANKDPQNIVGELPSPAHSNMRHAW